MASSTGDIIAAPKADDKIHSDQNGNVEPHVRHGSVDYGDLTLPKKLIVCCDGTWMNSDNTWVEGGLFSKGYAQNPTNVTRITRAIAAEDDGHHPQIVYYQAGIGTGLGLKSRLVGGGTGLGLAENIREAYAFLANNYRENDPDNLIARDSIFLLGFSRGAFTARSIGGLIGAVGLLKKRAMPFFYAVFNDWENAGRDDYAPTFFDDYYRKHPDLKKVKPPDALARDKNKVREYLTMYFQLLLDLDLSQEVQIKCIGVWDTVGALGVPVNPLLQKALPFLPSFVHEYRWFDTSLDNHVVNAFQALGLDEHRYPFSPTLWEKPEGCTANLKQCWFPGAHSNIGGSYDDTGIADITLAWMMDQLAGNTTAHPDGFVHHDWIKFDDEYIDYWYSSDLQWVTANKAAAYQGWGMGHVYNSDTFPESLAGRLTRTPGLYHRTNYDTGKTEQAQFLQNTNEHMHACVRLRVDLGGRSVEADESPKALMPRVTKFFHSLLGLLNTPSIYQPEREGKPLHGWRLLDGHSGHETPPNNIDLSPTGQEGVIWRWEGNPAECGIPGKELNEDRLGPIERRLLRKDVKIAEDVLFSNNGWKAVVELQKSDNKNGKAKSRTFR